MKRYNIYIAMNLETLSNSRNKRGFFKCIYYALSRLKKVCRKNY
jgi:hypothetical protein